MGCQIFALGNLLHLLKLVWASRHSVHLNLYLAENDSLQVGKHWVPCPRDSQAVTSTNLSSFMNRARCFPDADGALHCFSKARYHRRI